MKVFFIAMALATSLPAGGSSVLASETSGTDIATACAANDKVSQLYCRTYILGVVEGFVLGAGLASGRDVVCIPDGVKASQLVLIVQKTMNEQPENLHLSAAAIVVGAMTHSFSCPNSN